MKVDAGSRAAVEHVANNMRERDFLEFKAVSPFDTRKAMAEHLAGNYSFHPDTIVASSDSGPVAVGAMVRARPNVATLMFFATDDFQSIAAPLTRFIRQRLFPGYRALGVHRIECISIEGYAEVHRWIETLGLAREAVLRGYGRNRETFVQFAWVAADVR